MRKIGLLVVTLIFIACHDMRGAENQEHIKMRRDAEQKGRADGAQEIVMLRPGQNAEMRIRAQERLIVAQQNQIENLNKQIVIYQSQIDTQGQLIEHLNSVIHNYRSVENALTSFIFLNRFYNSLNKFRLTCAMLMIAQMSILKKSPALRKDPFAQRFGTAVQGVTGALAAVHVGRAAYAAYNQPKLCQAL